MEIERIMKTQFKSEERLGYRPKEIYHFTKKENLESIKNDREIKRFSDVYTFYNPTLEESVWFLKNITCNSACATRGTDGIIRGNDNKIEDYVVLRIVPNEHYVDSSKYFKSHSTGLEYVDKHVICYKGNLRIKELEVVAVAK
jgi:hypothetical protein